MVGVYDINWYILILYVCKSHLIGLKCVVWGEEKDAAGKAAAKPKAEAAAPQPKETPAGDRLRSNRVCREKPLSSNKCKAYWILLSRLCFLKIFVFCFLLWNGVCERSAIVWDHFKPLLCHFIKLPSWAAVAGSTEASSKTAAEQPEKTPAGDKLWYWEIFCAILTKRVKKQSANINNIFKKTHI